MPRKPPARVVLVTVPNKLMSALRAYWTVMDLDKGPRTTHFWDLRYGAVNRWKADDSWPPHIHYTLMFKRGDGIDELDYLQERGSHPPVPSSWEISFDKGTFPEHFNPEYDAWMRKHMGKISEIEERKGQEAAWNYVSRNAPSEYIPNPENWTPEQAAAELREVMPKAIELFESERPPIDWKPKGFIV